MRRSALFVLGLAFAYVSASLVFAQDPASQDPASTGQKKRQGRRPSSQDGASSTQSPTPPASQVTTPKPPKEPRPQKEPKQSRRNSSIDPSENARRAQRERENATLVYGDSATKRYYRFRCDPASAELMMMNLGEARKLGFRKADCPGK